MSWHEKNMKGRSKNNCKHRIFFMYNLFHFNVPDKKRYLNNALKTPGCYQAAGRWSNQ